MVNGLADPDEMEQRALRSPAAHQTLMVSGVVQIEAVEIRGACHCSNSRCPTVMPSIYQTTGATCNASAPKTIVMALRRSVRRSGATRNPFDNRSRRGATAGDLSRSAIAQYLAICKEYDRGRRRRTTGQRAFAAAGVLRSGDGQPTMRASCFWAATAAVVASARDLIARYADRQMNDIFLRQQINGLPQQIRQAEAFLVDNMRRGDADERFCNGRSNSNIRAGGARSVANRGRPSRYAIRGRNPDLSSSLGSDQFLSPGRLPGRITIDNILEERFSRNERLDCRCW
ncbi:MAG: hypothetical protein H6637_01005 [Ardenticatenales bacterium]|nr:hypothetical protein [Ardenticatenales bacterium]